MRPLTRADVGPGLLAEVERGELGNVDLARVGHHELRPAAEHCLADHRPEDGVLLGDVRADEEDRLRPGRQRRPSSYSWRPEPKAIVRPATVEAWHRRAQWSTLCVPTTCRANFCIR